jgi:hypothetical protein
LQEYCAPAGSRVKKMAHKTVSMNKKPCRSVFVMRGKIEVRFAGEVTVKACSIHSAGLMVSDNLKIDTTEIAKSGT